MPVIFDQFKLLIENFLNSNNLRKKCIPFNISAVTMFKIIDLVRLKITLRDKNRLTRIHKTFFNTLSDNELTTYDNYDNKNPFD